MKFFFYIFFSCTAFAKIPEIHTFGPRLALAGLSFGYGFRFDPPLSQDLVPLRLEGEFHLDGEIISSSEYLLTFRGGDGRVIYRAVFDPPKHQRPGIYVFEGCIRVKNQVTSTSECWPAPKRSIEIVAESR